MTSQEMLCIYDYVNEGLASEQDPHWLKVTRGSLALVTESLEEPAVSVISAGSWVWASILLRLVETASGYTQISKKVILPLHSIPNLPIIPSLPWHLQDHCNIIASRF